MSSSWRLLAAIGCALTMAGGCDCGGSPPATPGIDAGLDAGLELPDGGQEPDAGTDAGVTPTTICQDVATKKCDWSIRCKSADEDNEGRPNDQIAATERAACEAREAENAGCLNLTSSWGAGRSVVDEAAYFACIDASYPAASCARDLNAVLAACVGLPFLQPATPEGGACANDFECQSGFCNAAFPSCGTCQPYRGLAQSCNRDAQCDAATSYCRPNNPRLCEPWTVTNAPCSTDKQCGPGNVCAFTPAFTRVCRAAKALGEACTGGRFECFREPDQIPRTVCSSSTAAGTCISTQTTAGASCGTGELFGPYCIETEYCSANLCTPRRLAGQPCTDTDQCAFGTVCPPIATNPRVCTAYAAQGEPCAQSSRCQNMLSCQGATCESATALLDEACNATVPCVQGFCDPMTLRCTARKEPGETCANPNQCASFTCAGGNCQEACWD